MQSERGLTPIHPGEILAEEFLRPLRLSVDQLALNVGLPADGLRAVVDGNAPVTSDIARRIGAFFDVSAETWLALQADYDERVRPRPAA